MRRTAVAALVVLCAFVAASLVLFVFVPSDHPRHADVIVVLSGVRSRVDKGLQLRTAGVAPTLVISRDPDEWRQGDRLCARRALCFHAHPYSTQGEAEEIARLARKRDWRRIVIVTSGYHLRRSRMLFKRCLGYAPQMVAAHTGIVDYARNIPWEWAKFTYQVTLNRDC